MVVAGRRSVHVAERIVGIAHPAEQLHAQLAGARRRNPGQEGTRLLQHIDRFAMRVSMRRILRGQDQIADGALMFAAFFAMQREFRRELARR